MEGDPSLSLLLCERVARELEWCHRTMNASENIEPLHPEEPSAPEPELVDADKVKITPKGILLAIANLFTTGLTGGS